MRVKSYVCRYNVINFLFFFSREKFGVDQKPREKKDRDGEIISNVDARFSNRFSHERGRSASSRKTRAGPSARAPCRPRDPRLPRQQPAVAPNH